MTEPQERAHNADSEFRREGTSPNCDPTNVIDQFVVFADKTVDEVTRIGKDALTSENAPKLAAGATIGAVAGVLLPFLTLPIGAIAGAGYVAWRQHNQRTD